MKSYIVNALMTLVFITSLVIVTLVFAMPQLPGAVLQYFTTIVAIVVWLIAVRDIYDQLSDGLKHVRTH